MKRITSCLCKWQPILIFVRLSIHDLPSSAETQHQYHQFLSKPSISSSKMSDPHDEVESAFPIPCAFCRIATAYPASTNSTSASSCDAVPLEDDFDSQKISPSCFLILNTPDVMAFLDIMPITPGHLLFTTRKHWQRIGEVRAEEGREIGTF